MCLVTTNKPKKRRFFNKTVYKIFIIGKKSLITPYMHSEVLPGDIMSSIEPLPLKPNFYQNIYEIEEEGVHAFISLNAAKMYIECLGKDFCEGSLCIFKCIIPKGTRYIKRFWRNCIRKTNC